MTKEELKKFFVTVYPDQSIGSYNHMMNVLREKVEQSEKENRPLFTLGRIRTLEELEQLVELGESNYHFLLEK